MGGTDEPGEINDPPGPSERPWVHPSEIPAALEPRPARTRVLPVAAGLGALALLGIAALVDQSVGISGGARSASTLGRSALFVGPASLAPAAPGVVTVAAWSGPRVRYGSALVVDDEGHLVTSARLAGWADGFEVVTEAGERVRAELLARDLLTDVAVLGVDHTMAEPLSAATGAVRPGGDYTVVGAGGAGEGLVAAPAVVAAMGEVVRDDHGWLVDVVRVETDAPVTAVGGALVDGTGAVVGLVSRPSPDHPGLLVVPMARAHDALVQLLRNGRVDHPWLGLAAAEELRGLRVRGVAAGSPAQRAGVEEGDLIRRLGAVRVEDVGDLMRAVHRLDVGAHTRLTLVRRGRLTTVTLAVGRAPGDLSP